MSKSLWAPHRKIEGDYRRAIKQAMVALGKRLVGLSSPGDIISALYAATSDPWFVEYSQATAMKMVTNVFTDAGRTWREAANKNSRGFELWVALQAELHDSIGPTVRESIERNAEYIRSVPADIARQMTEHTMTEAVAGMRSEDLARDLFDLYPHISEVKANLIARTETMKTHTAIEEARCQTQQIAWYQWRTSEDARVRDSHRLMDKVLVAWDDPPSPEMLAHEKDVGRYHAGCVWNCRCLTIGIVYLDDISWPAKVYHNGAIQRMTRAQFEQIWTPSAAEQLRRELV